MGVPMPCRNNAVRKCNDNTAKHKDLSLRAKRGNLRRNEQIGIYVK